MASFPHRRNITVETFNRIRQVWEEMADSIGARDNYLTEADIPTPNEDAFFFCVIDSPQFSALSIGRSHPQVAGTIVSEWSFDPMEVRQFISNLPIARRHAKKDGSPATANDSQLQTEFTLRLMAAIEPNSANISLESALQAAQSANEAKSDFIALLSHELRTPLTSILGLAATLTHYSPEPLSDRQKHYLETIAKSGYRLSEMIDDMLQLSQLEVGQAILRSKDFSILNLLQQVRQIVISQASERHISIETKVLDKGKEIGGTGKDLRFFGDRNRIEQILTNFLTNAIKFTEPYGNVCLRAWCENEGESRYAVFQVEDNGIGIDSSDIPQLFQKFKQLHRPLERRYTGMGLGLALAKQLAELHGGTIEVSSAVRKGSIFTARLLEQESAHPAIAKINDRAILNNGDLPYTSVAAISEDEAFTTFLCNLLTTAHYQVTCLSSPESALKQIEVVRPQFLAVDLQLGVDRVQHLMQAIGYQKTLQNLQKIAIVSPEATVSSEVLAYFDTHLMQPIEPEELLNILIDRLL
jgi:two-component system, sensor histidine kinase and response regulator